MFVNYNSHTEYRLLEGYEGGTVRSSSWSSNPDPDPMPPGFTSEIETRINQDGATPAYVPTDGPTENPAQTDSRELPVDASYRQVRTWTGRNLDNTANVTLITYGSWSKDTNPPQDAPDITKSEPTTETRDADKKIRKTIAWNDGNGNSAYRRTAWYSPTEYQEVRRYASNYYTLWNTEFTYGEWSTSNPPPAAPGPVLGSSDPIRTTGSDPDDPSDDIATYTWTFPSGRALAWQQPDPDNYPPPPEPFPYASTIDTRTIVTGSTTESSYVQASGPTENPARIEQKSP